MEIRKKINHSLFVMKLFYWLLLSMLIRIKGPSCSQQTHGASIFKTSPNYQGPILSCGSTLFDCLPEATSVLPVADAWFSTPNQRGFMKTLESVNLWERREKRPACKVCLVHRERRSRKLRHKGREEANVWDRDKAFF